ncbi:MAG: multiheme c-type cytochrome [Aureliella sp.]
MTMRRWRSRCSWLALSLMFAWAHWASGVQAQTADAPRFIGRASCATATCHGGLVGVGPVWHSSSSAFESSDPHARAGEVLLNDLSKRIVAALEPEAASSEDSYWYTLQTRCVSCHAPEALPSASHTALAAEAQRVHRKLSAGVSCEACHGPASVWQKEHTRQDWNQSDRFTAASGMLDTESPLARTDHCTRCHVGSRSADGQIRDMNHDMIAAGHPALYFDMWRFQARLPPHWRRRDEALASTPPSRQPQTVEALQTRVLLSAVRLAKERRVDAARAPQPELSEYDCAACHHRLAVDSPRLRRGSSGSALWQPWYTAGRQLQVPRTELRIDRADVGRLLTSLEASLRQSSEESMRAPELEPRAYLERLLASGQPDNRADYCGAAAWLDQIEIAGRALAQSEAGELPAQFDKLVFMFRKDVLGYQSPTPTALEVVLPRAWDQRDLAAVGKELTLSIAPDESRGRR